MQDDEEPSSTAPVATSIEPAESATQPRDELDELWRHVVARWDDPKVHDLFVQTCFDRKRLDRAAAQYKSCIADPERSSVADKRLQNVVFLASQALEEDRSAPVKSGNRWLMIVAVIVCVGSIAVLLYALAR